jgi:hypothetical protein
MRLWGAKARDMVVDERISPVAARDVRLGGSISSTEGRGM